MKNPFCCLAKIFQTNSGPNEPNNGDEANPPAWPDDGVNNVVKVSSLTSNLQEELDKYQEKRVTRQKQIPGTDPPQYSDDPKDTVSTFLPDRHFDNSRTAILFEPGTYECDLQVGYYKQVLGLGASADDVAFTVTDTCRGPYVPAYDKHVCHRNGDSYVYGSSLDTFWRSAENFSTNGDLLWAVSQAAPLRRVHCRGNLSLSDSGAFASGGHLANAQVDGTLDFGSQQQYCCRSVNISTDDENGSSNTILGAWSNVFVDCKNPPPSSAGGEHAAVTLNDPDITVEKPFIAIEGGKYKLHVPAPRRPRLNSKDAGPILASCEIASNVVDFARIYVAKAKIPGTKGIGYVDDLDISRKINKALRQGKHVILSPGIYKLTKPIELSKSNQVLLGIGMATLVAPNNGSACIRVLPKTEGVRIAGIMLEASRIPSSRQKVASLLEWGTEGLKDIGNPENPGVLSDIFARVGGPSLDRSVSTDVMIRIHSDHVIGDNLWLWRADHVQLGKEELPNFPPLSYHQTVKGEVPVKTGLEVNGDHVTIHGLAVEHTTEHQVVWKGENGNVQFYQCELPYDVTYDFGTKNCVGYKVSADVQNHSLGGAGVYSNFRDDNVLVKSAIHHPQALSSEQIVNPFVVHLDNQGLIMTVVTDGEQNGGGPALPESGPSRFPVTR